MQTTRRGFLAATTAAFLSSGSRAAGPNDTIRIALVGAGWRGGQLVPQFAKLPGVRIVSVCDPDSTRAAEKAKQVEDATGGVSAKVEIDMRRVMEDDSVDAVVSATPNHWHCLTALWACEAGKHVYAEKPLAHSLWESRQMVNAARKYGRIVQCGTHRRSFPHLDSMMKRIHAGEFGRVLRVRAITRQFRESIGRRATPMLIPPEVDYNFWAGPAPMDPIYRDKFHYDWHWMWATGNGELANNGSHMLDLARWALGQKDLAPAVTALGGRFYWDDAGETPNTVVVHFDYKPAPLIAELCNVAEKPGTRSAGTYRGQRHGFVVECADATVVGVNHVEIVDRDGKVAERYDGEEGVLHPANFIEALRNGSPDTLTCPVEVGHASCGLALQGNISYLLGSTGNDKLEAAVAGADPQTKDTLDRILGQLDDLGIESASSKLTVGPTLTFDPRSEQFTGSRATEANRLLRRDKYRDPFVVHEVT